jgi:hypothetical protein
MSTQEPEDDFDLAAQQVIEIVDIPAITAECGTFGETIGDCECEMTAGDTADGPGLCACSVTVDTIAQLPEENIPQ